MKKRFWTGLLVGITVMEAGAQQNLFNVPSSEITAPRKVFFQQQFNVNRTLQSNTNVCVGLGEKIEI